MHDNWKTVLQLTTTLSAVGINKEKFWLDSELAPSSRATFHSLRKILGKIKRKYAHTVFYTYISIYIYIYILKNPLSYQILPRTRS